MKALLPFAIILALATAAPGAETPAFFEVGATYYVNLAGLKVKRITVKERLPEGWLKVSGENGEVTFWINTAQIQTVERLAPGAGREPFSSR